ncbi:MAG: hypothetical protein GY771_14955 [bacterium]|nr:hypothetical protein [bacterium]
MRFAIVICVVSVLLPNVMYGAVWVGMEGSLNKYSDEGETLKELSQYRNPVALTADRNRNRLWFIDQYDYTLFCLDAGTGEEIYRLRDIASPPGTDASSTEVFSSEGLETAPAMAVDEENGSLWIADIYAHQIVRVNVYGEQELRKSGFRKPYVIAIEPDGGNIWVNSGDSLLLRLDSDGEQLYKRTGMNQPRAVAVCPVSGVVRVADYGSSVVRGFDVSGELVSSQVESEPPVDLLINDDGSFWVIDQYEVARLYSQDGDELATYDRLEKPLDIDSDGSGSVWILDPALREAVHVGASGDEISAISNTGGARSIAVF